MWCGLRAEDFDRDEIELPTAPPPGSAPTVPVRILALTRACWNYDKNTLYLVADGLDTLLTVERPVLEWQAVVHGGDGGVIIV